MTEQEWLSWNGDPGELLDSVRDEITSRKLRFFACACCRRIWHLLTDIRSRQAVEIAELFADEQVNEEKLSAARVAANAVHFEEATQRLFSIAAHAAAAALYTAVASPIRTFAAANRAAASVGAKNEAEQKVQSALFRDILGNPFRPVAFDLSWRTPSVVNLAEAIYQHLAFDCMPLLAGALEEVGCRDADLLAHCRWSWPHVRGCWVVDLILGKE